MALDAGVRGDQIVSDDTCARARIHMYVGGQAQINKNNAVGILSPLPLPFFSAGTKRRRLATMVRSR